MPHIFFKLVILLKLVILHSTLVRLWRIIQSFTAVSRILIEISSFKFKALNYIDLRGKNNSPSLKIICKINHYR
jgi:hypothetical protein